MFDFAKGRADAKKALESTKLELLILGHSGAGKSYTIGTLGVPTLYLYATKESHGPVAASTEGKSNISPLCFNRGIWPGEKMERPFTADESLQYLHAILKDIKYLKAEGFQAIAVDGLGALESVVKESIVWKDKCKTAKGGHNTFKESEASQEVIGDVIDALKYCKQELDIHIIMTGILDVKEKDAHGAVLEATPKMGGYGLAEAMNQHFADIVVTGRMVKNGEAKYKFQFMVDLVKASKDEHGNIKKAMNFSPRLTGCAVPDIMDADLSKLATLKKAR